MFQKHDVKRDACQLNGGQAKRDKKELVRRFILFIIGLFISAQGVAITKTGCLGVSPVSSIPNVFSYKFTALTMGNWLIIWNCTLILGQIVLQGRRFRLFQFLQVPLSFLFGYFTDFGMWLVKDIPTDLYVVKILFVLVGTATLGCGVSLTVIADVIMNSGEAFVKVLSDTLRKDFGNVKIGFDITNVAISILLSLLFFRGKIVGTREGTLIAAVCTGLVVKFCNRYLTKPVSRFL